MRGGQSSVPGLACSKGFGMVQRSWPSLACAPTAWSFEACLGLFGQDGKETADVLDDLAGIVVG